jgi:hypothetical protein
VAPAWAIKSTSKTCLAGHPDADRRIGYRAKYMTKSMTEAADPGQRHATGARRPAGRRSRCRALLTQPLHRSRRRCPARRPPTGNLGDGPVAVRAVDVALSIDQHAMGQFERQDLQVVQVRIPNGSDRAEFEPAILGGVLKAALPGSR